MSNKIETTPAAELVGEWNQKSWVESKSTNHQDWRERRQEIAQELDRRCDAAGISIQFGTHLIFKHASSVVSNYPYPEWKISMEATELHALLGWLLMKETK